MQILIQRIINLSGTSAFLFSMLLNRWELSSGTYLAQAQGRGSKKGLRILSTIMVAYPQVYAAFPQRLRIAASP